MEVAHWLLGAVLAVATGADAQPVPAPAARRIISLAPHLTENLFTVGAGARLVGADDYSNYPQAALAVPRIGRAGALDVERIVALKPDLVLAWESGNPAGQIAQLRRLGVRVEVSESRTAQDIARELRWLGQLAGEPGRGEQAATAFETGWRTLQDAYGARAPVSVFYEIWHEPLMTVSDQHSIGAVIRLCGGRNVFGGLGPLAPTVGVESVLRSDPQAIIGSGSDATRPRWLDDWRRWPQLRAVRSNALIDVPPDLMQRPTVRLLDGAQRVCAALDQVRRQAGK